jgi:hypothetical protein
VICFQLSASDSGSDDDDDVVKVSQKSDLNESDAGDDKKNL